MAIPQSDGSIILTTQVDTSGAEKGTKSLKAQASELGAEYKKASASQGEAMKKAGNEAKKNASETRKATEETKKWGNQTQQSGNSAKNAVNSVTSSFKQLASAMGVVFGFYGLVQFGKQAVTLASDLQEAQNVVDVSFGEMKYKMEEFAKTSIETLGISKLTAKQTGSMFMSMADGMGVAKEDASDMALSLTALSADMASFFNVRQDEAKTALASVFTGETETLKRYGVVMTEVNLQEFARQKGIQKSLSAMTQQEKVMLRYQFVMNATKNAQGDFLRTQDSFANSTRNISEKYKEFQVVMGETIIVLAEAFLPVVEMCVEVLTVLGLTLGAFVNGLNGVKAEERETVKQSASLEKGVASVGSAVSSTVGIFSVLPLPEKSALAPS